MVCFSFPYMLSKGVFYLPIHAFVYEVQIKMYLIVTSFVVWADISPAQGVDKVNSSTSPQLSHFSNVFF